MVTDRIVQTAMRNVIEPIYERTFAEQSYGFRPGRGCKDALRRVEELLRNGYTWVVDADIKSYFDSIHHDKLMKEVEEQIADGRILEMILKFNKSSFRKFGKVPPPAFFSKASIFNSISLLLYVFPFGDKPIVIFAIFLSGSSIIIQLIPLFSKHSLQSYTQAPLLQRLTFPVPSSYFFPFLIPPNSLYLIYKTQSALCLTKPTI